jgi:hypothetical protein
MRNYDSFARPLIGCTLLCVRFVFVTGTVLRGAFFYDTATVVFFRCMPLPLGFWGGYYCSGLEDLSSCIVQLSMYKDSGLMNSQLMVSLTCSTLLAKW